MEILTCKDFVGDCCQLCHDLNPQGEDNLEEVTDADNNLFALVCCLKTGQAELRAHNITEAIPDANVNS